MNFDAKILIVDDELPARKLLMGYLQKIGYENLTDVDSAEKAIQKLCIEKFDLVISDWNMPQMTGLEFYQLITERELITGVPFLMVTSVNEKDNVLKAIKMGVQGYIIKPFDVETLQDKIDDVLK
ncbi:MAG: response regulator [Candidatus Nitrohelix vancouverensis]|uniref:Response regulator n=1 Tax=Candidatus Nitrohelix vancouverensis TaxID=2705534 RepID=A0A7T0C0R8_9BACT|nr:MAG: response regulator [Candidatus Nitrohelix vancouverensis]